MRKIQPILALVSFTALAACGGETPAETPVDAPEVASVEPPVELAFADLTGDPAAGEAAYARCRACHMLTEDGTSVGPTLYGVVGRPAGSVAGYNYSAANG